MDQTVKPWCALLLWGMLALGWQSSARAELVDTLYSAEVLVPGQDAEFRTQGMQQALVQVLGKLSGGQLTADDALLGRIGDAGRFARTFAYRDSDRTLPNEQGEAIPASWMRVSFDPAGVTRLARELDLPIWGANRPSVLVWLVEESRGKRRIVASGGTEPVIEALSAAGESRGLPLMLPLMDIDDRTAISDTDLWGLFAEPISEASQRYNPGAILAGRYYRASATQWVGRWMMILRGERVSLDVKASSEAELVERGVDLAVRELASRYAVRLGEASEIPARLVLGGVKSVEAYAQAIDYLQKLTAVRSAKPMEVRGDQLTLHLTIDGSLQQLQEVIALEQQMLPEVERNAEEPQGSRSLYYQWQVRP
ncbi:DUF2066 domain-containing protein [Aestuariirhabdus litorea]|uniref:DUF2066 domain-containing protein n=1 Tax=Aestuariirhabdus litorea TaxID=2528527 RepID=A0A3P3VRJ9_9GAMM|nr:DUF2066 domain-containing protein [Aestuariirhabdus litorea]RRJ84149.1 DUF2066 domain-containing protein [Aestuariirhabdus litorea]RWW97369.1 DUF2066 domain-containing protein [Endozoicomonadaceae bacterium GTF-13]